MSTEQSASISSSLICRTYSSVSSSTCPSVSSSPQYATSMTNAPTALGHSLRSFMTLRLR